MSLSRQEVLAQLREQLPYLAREYGVRRIGLFGSCARGTAGPNSDVDLVVEFDRPPGFRFMELADDLEDLLQSRVELLTPAGLQAIRHRSIAEAIEADIVYA